MKTELLKQVTPVILLVLVLISISAIKDKGASPPSTMDIDTMVNQFLSNEGYMQGWNDEKETFVAVGLSALDSDAPSHDNSFLIKRSLKSMEAALDAKAKIIEFIHTKMSVMDRASTPGTDLNVQFKKEIDELDRKMNTPQNMLVDLLSEENAVLLARTLKAASLWGPKIRLMGKAIRKLNKIRSNQRIKKKKLHNFKKAKKLFEKAEDEYNKLNARITASIGSMVENLTSKVETISTMPLMGGLIIEQFEEWNSEEKRFRTAIVMIWSKKMETIARGYIAGKSLEVPPGKMSLSEYLNNRNWASSTGGRRFFDNKGRVYFLGIGTAAIGSSASSEKRARGIASAIAKKEVAMAIFTDISSHKKSEQMMETYNKAGKDTSVAIENLTNELSQSIQNRRIYGIQSLYTQRIKHPISGQKIYVSIYGISGQPARKALWAQESDHLTQIMNINSRQKPQWGNDDYEASDQKASTSPTFAAPEKSSDTYPVDGQYEPSW